MASLRGGSSIATLLAAATLALGACGGDDGGSDGGTTGAATPTETTTGTTETGTTGTTTRERTGTREDRTTTRERDDDSGGRNRGSGGGGSNGSGGGSGGDDSGSVSQPATQPGNVYKTAKTVCNSFLPKQIAKDLREDDRQPESVARDYSRGFPSKQQKRAYEGCLAGLKAR